MATKSQIVTTIVRSGIQKFSSIDGAFGITLPKRYNQFLDNNTIFLEAKQVFKENGYSLAYFSSGGWGGGNEPGDYDIFKINT